MVTINPATFGLRLDPPGPWDRDQVGAAALPRCPHRCGHRIAVQWSNAALPGEVPAYVPARWWCPRRCDVTSRAARALARVASGWPAPASHAAKAGRRTPGRGRPWPGAPRRDRAAVPAAAR